MFLMQDDKHYLSFVHDWIDPNPAPIVQIYDKFQVVRDDLLGFGSKLRFIDKFVKDSTAKEFVFGGANKIGWGPIALAECCRRYGKKCTIFMAKRAEPTWHQKRYMELGGKIKWVNMGMLTVTKAKAKAYWEKDIDNREILPLGLEHPTVIGSIIKVARSIKFPKPISEIWTVASSGTLSRGLQLAFPEIPVIMVQTGHKMNEREIGRAEKVYISPYKFDAPVKNEDTPPWPSEKFYDAKIYPFLKKHGKENAMVWNVAG